MEMNNLHGGAVPLSSCPGETHSINSAVPNAALTTMANNNATKLTAYNGGCGSKQPEIHIIGDSTVDLVNSQALSPTVSLVVKLQTLLNCDPF